MSNVLIIRLSALGDVAMTIPVVYSAAEANPQDAFTVLTHENLLPLFINRPPNVSVKGVNTKSTEKSLWGFLRYIFRLRKCNFDVALDLHSVIRSRIADVFFRLSGKKVFIIDKGRNERRNIVRRPPKKIEPLLQTVDRYADVFHAAGYRFDETFTSLFEKMPVDEKMADEKMPVDMAGEKKGFWVGIAPFAKHKGKIYPIEKMAQVMAQLSERDDITLFLFGGRGEEEELLNRWAAEYKNTVNMAGRYALSVELAFMSRLDVLVSMDSANMHLASIAGTKVISVWGATHPYAGFYGYRQPKDLAIQVDLPCRPCSIYGNKPCYRGDWACMREILPEQITRKVNDYLRGV